MLLNLTDVLTSEGKVRSENIAIETETFVCREGSFPITDRTPLALTITNEGMGKARLEGKASVTQKMFCDRCLKDVEVVIPLDIDRMVYSPDVHGSEFADDSDVGVMDGWQLDIEVLVYNELLLNQPEKVLCSPDCRGICKKCGKDLNEGDCGCDTFVPDPRLAVLQDIFDGNKEV